MTLFSSASDYGKDVWLPTYANQLEHSEGSWLQMLGLNTDDRIKIEGRRAFMKVQTGDDLGFAVLGQGGDFGAPGDIASDEAQLELMRFSDTISFDAHEMALLDSLTAAAAPVMRQKMKSSRMRTLRELERMTIMNGEGALAKVASVATTAVTLDAAGSDYTERNPYTWIDDPLRSRYIGVDPTTGADQDESFTVTAINETTNVLTASTDQAALAAGDLIVTHYGDGRFASGGAFTSPEMDGLLAMIDDGNTYMNLNRATGSLAFWRATVVDNGGTLRDLTDDLIDELLNKTARRAENGMVVPSEYCGTASPGVWTSYHRLLTTGLRYTVSETPDIGWGGRQFLPMEGVPLYKHIHSPRHQIMLVHKKSAKFIGPKHDQSEVFKFLDRNGSIFFQANASSGQAHADQVFAYIVGWLGLYTERPRNHSRLDDLNETAPAYAGQ